MKNMILNGFVLPSQLEEEEAEAKTKCFDGVPCVRKSLSEFFCMSIIYSKYILVVIKCWRQFFVVTQCIFPHDGSDDTLAKMSGFTFNLNTVVESCIPEHHQHPEQQVGHLCPVTTVLKNLEKKL